MKLSMEEVQKLKESVIADLVDEEYKEINDFLKGVLRCVETIEAQQKEIEQLKNQNDTMADTINMLAPYAVGKTDAEMIEDLKQLATLKQQVDAKDTALERATRGIKSIIEQYTTDFTEDELSGDALCPREKVVLEYANETLELLEAVGGVEK